mgnify:CR=1 FL=1
MCIRDSIRGIDQEGRVRVVHHVLFLIELLIKDVADHAAEEGDIGTRTNRSVHIGLRGGTCKARVNNDPLGSAVNGTMTPAGRKRMVFNVVGTDGHDDVSVLEVTPVAGHGAASEGRSKTGNGRGVADTGLVVDLDNTERTGEFLNKQASSQFSCAAP